MEINIYIYIFFSHCFTLQLRVLYVHVDEIVRMRQIALNESGERCVIMFIVEFRDEK